MADIIGLIAVKHSTNEYGVPQSTELPDRIVMCEEKSITQREFFEAGRNGFNPEVMLEVFDKDYRGEMLLRYKGERFAVYRTYRPPGGDVIELYCERKGGANGR